MDGGVLSGMKYEIKNLAERLGSIYGYVLDKNGKATQADVYLIEFGGKRRIAKLNTTKEGHFVFHNVDLSSGIHVSTKLPNSVYLIEGMPIIAKEESTIDNTEDGGVIDLSQKSADVKELRVGSETRGGQFELQTVSSMANQSALDEVVVVGYGTQKRVELTSSIVTVREAAWSPAQTPNGITSALSGAVPGLVVSSRDMTPGESSTIRIRGTSSISTTEPLVLVNGIPVEGALSNALSMVNPADIESLEVLKSVNASAIYGSRASNGVILISTKRAYFKQKYKQPKPEYSGATVAKREFYKDPGFTQRAHNQSRDNSTVYWRGNIYTNEAGKTELSFFNNKQSSTFRITAEGISSSEGILATTTKRIVTQEAFSIDAKVPLFAGSGDKIKVPVMLKNMTNL